MTPPSSPIVAGTRILPALLASGVACSPAFAADTPPTRPIPAYDLPAMLVRGEAEFEGVQQDPFLPDIQATEIFAGKKTTVLDLDALPKVQANNYRQALTRAPGLLYSEESTPLVSIGYRGIGEPHRMQFLQVLKDGIPIHADPFGYPEAYYTPPLDVVDRLEFVRGGASLLYGPQPGGALNYVTYMPRRDRPFSGRSFHTFGSDNLYSTYSSIDGTHGPWGYLAYFNHRQSDGFRSANSDYQLDGGHFKVVHDSSPQSQWILALDAYEEGHGEPGGLTFASGPGLANYDQDRNQASRLYDRFRLRRYVPSLQFQHEFTENTQVSAKAWGGYYDRFSRRQNGGGFGQLPTGPNANSNAIERQEFYTAGTEARLRHDYLLGTETQTLTAGLHYYHADSPRRDQRGATPDAESGTLVSQSDRGVHYGSVFAENRFRFGDFSIVPGIRLENFAQDVRVSRPTATGTQRSERGFNEFKPLLGLALSYALPAQNEIYANVAQGYRPTIFTESIIPGSGTVISGDVEPTESLTYELGWRGRPFRGLSWDTSLFLIDLDNRYGGTVTAGGLTELRSVGRSINYGWDLAVEFDLVEGLRPQRDPAAPSHDHRLLLHSSLTLLQAEIHGGTQDGRVPQYAPETFLRAGLIHQWKNRGKLALLGTFLSDHFATDDENPTRRIPAYMTWDLTVEVLVYRDHVSLVGGINNLFDEDYYARIRGDGIDPAYRRNFYAGIQLAF